MNEVERIKTYVHNEIPPPVGVRVQIASAEALATLTRIQEVVAVVAEKDSDDWPTDEGWSELLPDWFLSGFRGLTLEQLTAEPAQWDYGSWLDSMQTRGWRWWSADCSSIGLMINLTAEEFPYRTGALEYLIRRSGGSVVSINEMG